jgi:hypothetical protein
MDGASKLDRAALRAKLLSEFESTLEVVADSLDGARDGHWINDSEEPSRQALDRLRQKVYEAAVQAKTDAAEAAFPPSGQPDDGPAAAS